LVYTGIFINILGFAKINKVLLGKSKNMELQVTTGWQKVLSVISNTEYIKQKSNPDIIKNYLSDTVDTIYNSMSDVNMYSVSTSTLIHSINSIFQIYEFILTYKSIDTRFFINFALRKMKRKWYHNRHDKWNLIGQ